MNPPRPEANLGSVAPDGRVVRFPDRAARSAYEENRELWIELATAVMSEKPLREFDHVGEFDDVGDFDDEFRDDGDLAEVIELAAYRSKF